MLRVVYSLVIILPVLIMLSSVFSFTNDQVIYASIIVVFFDFIMLILHILYYFRFKERLKIKILDKLTNPAEVKIKDNKYDLKLSAQ